MSFEKWLENSSVLLERCFIFTNNQGFIYLIIYLDFFFFFWKKQHVFHFFKKLTSCDPLSK